MADQTRIFRVYDETDVLPDGYPVDWHCLDLARPAIAPGIKDLVRDEAGNRCVRCGHPYEKGMGEWSPCDDRCDHIGPWRIQYDAGEEWITEGMQLLGMEDIRAADVVQAQWRILTVHHLNGVKFDCRWWNLVALCQRCHLTIQRRVILERVWPWEHTPWFKPYAAAWYAWSYLGEDLTREETDARLEELLALERAA